MSNISNSELLETMSEVYDKNVVDIKKGLYGKYIKTNDDGTFLVEDKVLSKTLKIVDDEVFVGLDSDVFRLIIEILPSIDLDIIYRIEIFDNKQWQIFIEHKDMNKLISEFKEKYNSSVTDEDAKI